MRAIRLLSAILLSLTLGACNHSTASNGVGDKATIKSSSVVDPATTKDGTSGNDTNAEAAVIQIQELGSEPRQALRYQFAYGQTETAVLEMQTTMKVKNGPKVTQAQQPLIRMTLNFNNTRIDAAGNFHYDFKVIDVAETDRQVNAPRASSANDKLQDLVGISGWAIVDSRGITHEAHVDPVPGADAQIGQAVDSMRRSVRELSAPLPSELVGKGAKWTATCPVDTGAIRLTQVTNYSLLELTPNSAAFEVEVTQLAQPQELHPPGLPPGGKAQLESLSTSGKGTINLDFTKLVATSKMAVTTTTKTSVSAHGRTEYIDVELAITTTIKRLP